MKLNFKKLRIEDNSWTEFLADWQAQCDQYGEDFETYVGGPIETLRELAEGTERKDSGAYALHDGERFASVCQVNVARIPDYDGKVLRVRIMYLSPHYDLSDIPLETYATIVVDLFFNVISLSNGGPTLAPHVKFHFRSPADRQFFLSLGGALDKQQLFKSIETRGSWLYITK